MIIDSLLTGTAVTEVSDVKVYADGKRTDEQAKHPDGRPLWFVTVAMQSGMYVLPLRVKVADYRRPSIGETVRFSGVEAKTWREGEILWTAQEIHSASEQDLDTILGQNGEK